MFGDTPGTSLTVTTQPLLQTQNIIGCFFLPSNLFLYARKYLPDVG